jgi:hypothetical protein
MFYDCSTFKPIHYHLQNLDETRGVPLRIYAKDGFCIAVFAWGMVAFPEEMEPLLRDMVGKEVCCLRLDGRYHIREVADA